MAEASYAVPNFLGGEISQFAQGRFDKPDYRTSLNVCFNMLPVEIGALVRRPGTQHGGTTRGGKPGRVIKFDFEQATPYTAEFTDGKVRFRNGATLITTNDGQAVVAVSAANPAVVQTAGVVNWATGDTLIFSAPSTPLLENRQFLATKIDTTHFSLVDAITGVAIDGSTLGALAAGATVSRVQELSTVYVGSGWTNLRAVQAETTDILLSASAAPQALTVPTLPSPAGNAVFAIAPAVFNDGPYLDPFTNGVQATPSAKTGIITLQLSFPAYSATTAYAVGSFVTSSSVNYVSLVDQNVGNTPASSPTFWGTTSVIAAINNGQGFLGTDIGRLVRLYSEPPLWLISSTYALNAIVSFNPSGQPGASTYWQSQVGSNTGNTPNTDLTNWKIVTGAAIWTWGKTTSLSTAISPSLAGSVAIGDMTGDGGVAAAFDGVFGQVAQSCASKNLTGPNLFPGQNAVLSSFVGKNYSGAATQKVQSATVYPSIDSGFAYGNYINPFNGARGPFTPTVVLNLRGKSTAPSSPSDGTLLGTSGSIPNDTSGVTILSSDSTTLWAYVWVELISTTQTVTSSTTAWTLTNAIGELAIFNPAGTGTSSGINVELLGPPLLYTNSIVTWRLGAYSGTTGWPTCGCYYEGRLWLGGGIPNRFDSSVSNGIVGGTINFAPTDQYGVVAGSNAITATLNSDSVNPIFWMQPDLQGIILGTQAGEYLVVAPTNGPLAPNNIAARRVTKIGCANVEPRRTEHTNVFVQRYSQKLMEYFADVYSGKFSAPNIADKAQHISRVGIAELAYQQAVAPIIWGRGADGSLFGLTYKRDTLTTAQGPTFNAWHRHSLGSGRTIESICIGPSVGGNLDTLTMITNDAVTGVRHVEVMTQAMDELTPLTASWFLDDAIVPTSTSTSNAAITGAPYGGLTLNGLSYLNGKTVSVFAGGLDCGDFAVASGSCFVPYGDGVSGGTGGGLFTAAYVASIAPFPIVVGFTFTSQGQLVRPIAQADTGARNGPGFGKLTRAHRYAVKLVNTLGLSIGTTFSKLKPANFKQANNAQLAPLTTFSGMSADTLDDDYSYDRAVCWQVTRPYPANIVAIGPNLATQDQ